MKYLMYFCYIERIALRLDTVLFANYLIIYIYYNTFLLIVKSVKEKNT